MIPPGAETAAPAEPPPIELAERDLRQLRRSAGWARFVAIVGFVVTGFIALAWIALVVTGRQRGLLNASTIVPLVIGLAGFGAGAVLILRYGCRVPWFLTHGDPALAQAFRHLRNFFKLWTLVVVFEIVMDVVALFEKL